MQNHSSVISNQFGTELLALSEHLFNSNDQVALETLQRAIAQLVLSSSQLEDYSLIEIGEYIDSLANDLKSGSGKSEESQRLFELVTGA